MSPQRLLSILGGILFVGIVVTVCLWSYYLGRIYMFSRTAAQSISGDSEVHLASGIAVLVTLAFFMGFCTVLSRTQQKSVKWIQILVVAFFATTSPFLWIFFWRNVPQVGLSVGGMPPISQQFIDSIDSTYQLAVASTVCGVIATLALIAGLLSAVSVRKKSGPWIGLLTSVLLASALVLAYFQLLASPHHREPDMWVSHLLLQFRLELLISFVALTLLAVMLGWTGDKIDVRFLKGVGLVGFIVSTLGAALVLALMKLNMNSPQGMWVTINRYDLRQWIYALLLCALIFAAAISAGVSITRKRP